MQSFFLHPRLNYYNYSLALCVDCCKYIEISTLAATDIFTGKQKILSSRDVIFNIKYTFHQLLFNDK